MRQCRAQNGKASVEQAAEGSKAMPVGTARPAKPRPIRPCRHEFTLEQRSPGFNQTSGIYARVGWLSSLWYSGTLGWLAGRSDHQFQAKNSRTKVPRRA